MKTLLYLLLSVSLFALPKVEVFHDEDAMSDAMFAFSQEAPGRDFGLLSNTGSMKPTYRHNDRLLLVRYTGQKIQPGDFIVYRRWDQPRVAHMVRAVSKTRFQCQGINCAYPDEWYGYDKIDFIVQRVLRYEEVSQ